MQSCPPPWSRRSQPSISSCAENGTRCQAIRGDGFPSCHELKSPLSKWRYRNRAPEVLNVLYLQPTGWSGSRFKNCNLSRPPHLSRAPINPTEQRAPHLLGVFLALPCRRLLRHTSGSSLRTKPRGGLPTRVRTKTSRPNNGKL